MKYDLDSSQWIPEDTEPAQQGAIASAAVLPVTNPVTPVIPVTPSPAGAIAQAGTPPLSPSDYVTKLKKDSGYDWNSGENAARYEFGSNDPAFMATMPIAPEGGYKTVSADEALRMYNSMDPELSKVDPNILNPILRGADYWKEGQFMPGSPEATSQTLQGGINQWAKDDKPGGFEKALPYLALAGIGAATGGFGLLGAAETAGWTSGFDLAGGGALGSIGAAEGAGALGAAEWVSGADLAAGAVGDAALTSAVGSTMGSGVVDSISSYVTNAISNFNMGNFAADTARRAAMNAGMQALLNGGSVDWGQAIKGSLVGAGLSSVGVLPTTGLGPIFDAGLKGGLGSLITSGGDMKMAAIGALAGAGSQIAKEASKIFEKDINSTWEDVKVSLKSDGYSDMQIENLESGKDVGENTLGFTPSGDYTGLPGNNPNLPYIGNDMPQASEFDQAHGVYLTPEQMREAAGLQFTAPTESGSNYLTPSGWDSDTLRWLQNTDTADLSTLEKALYLNPEDVLTGTRPTDYTMNLLDNPASANIAAAEKATENKKTVKDPRTYNQYMSSNTMAPGKKREFGDIPMPVLLQMGFDPALVALMNRR
jgi:hypothetical protein